MPTTAQMIEALIEMRNEPGGVPPDHFWQIVERFRADLVNQALAILGNQADAEDVSQESLAQSFVDLPQLKDPRKLGAWMRQINRCKAMDLRRKRKRQREERLATGQQEQLTKTSLLGPGHSSGEEKRGSAETDIIVRAVDSLPEEYREVVVLRYWEKLTLADVAERLSLPPGTVRSRMARADGMLLLKLRALMKAEEHPQ